MKLIRKEVSKIENFKRGFEVNKQEYDFTHEGSSINIEVAEQEIEKISVTLFECSEQRLDVDEIVMALAAIQRVSGAMYLEIIERAKLLFQDGDTE